MIRALHRWPGLLALALVTVLALSGAALSVFPMAERLAAPQAVAATKKLLATIGGQSLDASLNQGAQAFANALRSAEAGAGLKAFSSKQPAPWTCIAGGTS